MLDLFCYWISKASTVVLYWN